MNTNKKTTLSRPRQPSRRRGGSIIYVAIALMALFAICSLAVDFGRWELCNSQSQRAADSAARAGAFKLTTGYAAALSSATSVANANYLDAQTVGSNPKATLTVQLLNWTSSSNYVVLAPANYNQANAVRVNISYNVPLEFGAIIGISSKGVSRTATALLVTQTQKIYVDGKGDPWLAGEPTGTQGSQPDPGYQGQGVNSVHPWKYDYAGPVGGSMPDGQPYSSPPQASIPIVPGAVVTVTSVSGSATYDPNTPDGNANGTINGATSTLFRDAAANGVSEHGIADVTMPIDSMNMVFLNDKLPDSTAAPQPLDFSTQAQRDYSSISPELKHPFYVGTGTTSGGSQQSIVVPQGATRMFMGMMDGWEWDNNSGGYNATITERYVQMVQ